MVLLYLGLNSFSTIAATFMLNIKALNSIVLHLAFTVATLVSANKISADLSVIDAYKLTQIAWFLGFQSMYYLEEKMSKENFQ
jgi:hypothetical protein